MVGVSTIRVGGGFKYWVAVQNLKLSHHSRQSIAYIHIYIYVYIDTCIYIYICIKLRANVVYIPDTTQMARG